MTSWLGMILCMIFILIYDKTSVETFQNSGVFFSTLHDWTHGHDECRFSTLFRFILKVFSFYLSDSVWRFRRALSGEYLIAAIGVDTDENGSCEAWARKRVSTWWVQVVSRVRHKIGIGKDTIEIMKWNTSNFEGLVLASIDSYDSESRLIFRIFRALQDFFAFAPLTP